MLILSADSPLELFVFSEIPNYLRMRSQAPLQHLPQQRIAPREGSMIRQALLILPFWSGTLIRTSLNQYSLTPLCIIFGNGQPPTPPAENLSEYRQGRRSEGLAWLPHWGYEGD
jgi:hypothetical protein